uniref:Uncharacterized protein n=1 Tax=Anopheles maculatus TaxID=74869 RepID=A0A182SII2_9DIPT
NKICVSFILALGCYRYEFVTGCYWTASKQAGRPFPDAPCRATGTHNNLRTNDRNRSVKIIREAGILAYQQARYHAPRPRCVKDSHRTEPVQLFDVVSAFLLLATGIIGSCFLLLVELIFRCVQLRFRRRRVPLDFAAMT